METAHLVFSLLLIVTALLPLSANPHWIFRIWEFGRIQALVLQAVVLLAGLAVTPKDTRFWILEAALLLLIVNNIRVLLPYTKLYRRHRPKGPRDGLSPVSVLSVNVYQFNKEYERLVELVRREDPDIVLTMETNGDWEKGLAPLDRQYPTQKKIALENTYGMHFYTRLKVHRIEVHYFVSDDLPSIEAELETPDGTRFIFFGVHPAPPSPTEEETSKERDGELLSVAKKAKDCNCPTLVVGDFNNVAWARSSILFRKTSGLLDPRIGRGFVSTYHAKYRWLRFPIDLFFHSAHLFVEQFCTLPPIGSDHLPLYARFYIDPSNHAQTDDVEHLESTEAKEEVEEMIEEGKEEQSDRKAVVEE